MEKNTAPLAKFRPHLRVFRAERATIEADTSGIGDEDPRQSFQEHRFSRTAGPEYGKEASGGDSKIDALQNRASVEALPETFNLKKEGMF